MNKNIILQCQHIETPGVWLSIGFGIHIDGIGVVAILVINAWIAICL